MVTYPRIAKIPFGNVNYPGGTFYNAVCPFCMQGQYYTTVDLVPYHSKPCCHFQSIVTVYDDVIAVYER